MKAQFFAILAIILAIGNLVFATINMSKIQILYDNPTDQAALKNLKSIRDFAITTMIIFGLQLVTLILAYPRKIQVQVPSK